MAATELPTRHRCDLHFHGVASSVNFVAESELFMVNEECLLECWTPHEYKQELNLLHYGHSDLNFP